MSFTTPNSLSGAQKRRLVMEREISYRRLRISLLFGSDKPVANSRSIRPVTSIIVSTQIADSSACDTEFESSGQLVSLQ